ncbi:MAG TPA: hypothetical protein VHX15_07030 [Frankiaceae bacterium]|nr:hypothetical protein [Frankiaceae bacterium]
MSTDRSRGTRASEDLARSLRRLDGRIRRWSAARWTGRSADGRARVDAAHELAVTLAALGRRAGNLAPDIPPPAVAPHALADQFTVLGRELQEAPDVGVYAEAGAAAVERFLNGL